MTKELVDLGGLVVCGSAENIQVWTVEIGCLVGYVTYFYIIHFLKYMLAGNNPFFDKMEWIFEGCGIYWKDLCERETITVFKAGIKILTVNTLVLVYWQFLVFR